MQLYAIHRCLLRLRPPQNHVGTRRAPFHARNRRPRKSANYRVNLAFVFHAIELGLTRAAYCKTTVQRADFLTKALPVGAFRAAAAFVYPDYEFAKL